MADGDAASVLVHSDAGDQTHDPRADCPDESPKQTDKAGPYTEKPDGISCTGSNGDSVLPGETLERRGCPSGVTPAGCDETVPGQDSIIPVEPVKNWSHSSETQPAVIDTHSANVMPNQSDTENTPDKGCLMREDVAETPTQVTTHSQVTKDINAESSIGESDHQIASSCDVGSQHSSVSQRAVGCENGACDGGGAEKSPSKTSESTPRDVELSMSNISLCSHDSSSRATGLTSESFTGSESGLEYESDSYETGSTGSSATTTSRTDTSSSSITSPGTKSMQKRVDKVMNRLSESETANSEALDEIHGAIRDTINATMNVLDNDPPSTSSNDSELTASPVRQNRDSHQKNGTVSNEAVKSLPQDNHNHSSTLTPPGGACLEQSDVKRYSDNSEELLSELSAELELVGQTGSIEAPNGIASQVVSSLPEFKRLQAQLESVTTLCGRQQLQLDRLHVEKQESVASLELIYQAQIKELERTISKQDAEVRHVKDKLTSHDAAAKRAVGTLQEQLKLRVDQVTKMYRESVGEKDNMVMKYAQAEQRNIELADRMAKMDAARREFLKEKELAVGRFRSVVTEKQRLQDLLDAKSSETVALKRELERLRDQMTSRDIKVKWMENKLKAEVQSHKETRGKVDDFQKGLRQAKEETEQIRRNCQAMILTYQDSEEIKSNSLDTQLRAKEELLQKLKLDKASEQEQNRIMSTELNHLKVKHSELLEELHTYKDKVQCQETERLVQEQTLDKFRETLQAQKHTNHTMKERLQQLENVEQQLLDEQARAKELKEQVTMLEESNTDLQANMESCSVREMEHLEFTQKISGKNARIQSENITLNSTLDSLREEHEKLFARSTELQEKVDQLEHELAQEREEWKTENDSLTSRVAVKEKQVDELKTQLGDEKDENRTLKRRHAANIKDIMRQFQQAKRRLEVYEHRHGDHDSLGSNASSNGSLDTASTQQPPPPHSRGSSQEPAPPPPPQEEPFVEVIEIDKQMLLEKIVRLQKSHARKNEKIEFMEDHIQRLIREVQKKTRIIQSYVLREDAGSLAPAYMDVNKSRKHREEMKALLSRHGGIMASVFSSHSQDGTLTLDLSLEINRKLQAVVEDVLLKNITLKENIDTLGTEIARLSQENRQLQLRMQEAPLVNSNT